MATVEQVAIDVREVTDKEVAHFQEKGWVKLPGLIRSEAAAAVPRK